MTIVGLKWSRTCIGAFALVGVVALAGVCDAKALGPELRLLESGAAGGPSLFIEESALQEEREAIGAIFAPGAPSRSFEVDSSMLGPDSVLTVLIRSATGFPVTLEVAVDGLGIGAVPTTVTLYPGTLQSIFVRDPQTFDANLVPVPAEVLPEIMTREERNTAYFCHRFGVPLGGAFAHGLMGLHLGDPGGPGGHLVPVSLRRDAEQQKPGGAEELGEGTSDPDTGAGVGPGQWVISWFSSDCERDEKGGCPARTCDVPIVNLVQIAEAAGLEVPSGPEGWVLKKALKLLLGDVGYNVDGTCARVAIAPLPFLLRWFKADCQCILHAY